MKQLMRSIALTIGLCFASLPAQASEFEPYAGIGLGGFIIDAGLGSETAFGGFGILGADLHENYGVEFRFGATGDTGGTVIVPVGQIQVEGPPIIVPTPTAATIGIDWFFSYLLKLQYPFGEGLRIYGLIGGTTLKSNFVFAGGLGAGSVIDTTFSFGGGIDYSFGNQWFAGVDAMVYANDASTDPGSNFTGLDVWGLAAIIKYKF